VRAGHYRCSKVITPAAAVTLGSTASYVSARFVYVVYVQYSYGCPELFPTYPEEVHPRWVGG